METAVTPRASLPSSHTANPHAIELRVFEGPQSGARAPLAAGTGFVLAANPHGHADEADVVLRDDGGATARVRVTLDMHDALLEVLEGEVQIGERKLPAGEQAPWSMHAPLRIGRSVVAFGRAAVARWPGAIGAPALPAGDDEVPAHEDSTGNAPAAAAKTPLARRPEVWLAGLGAVVLIVCAGALGLAQVVAAPPAEKVEAPPPLAVQLRGSEFSALQATQRKDGAYELRGRLETLAQRRQLDTWLAERQLAATVDVQVDEALARDVTETFRINGVAVRAQVLGTGIVAVEVAERDAERLTRAEDVAKRDVRGLTKLTVRNTPPAAPKPVRPISDDPGKRIASVVPGDPAYLVTADGSRYFVGSLLPTGHRIAAIQGSAVTLEIDGEQTTLNF